MPSIPSMPLSSTSICLLALNGMMTTSLSLPLEMLTAASHMYRTMHRRGGSPALTVAGESLSQITTTGGLKILPDDCWENIGQAGVIFIPSFWRSPNLSASRREQLQAWLIAQHQGGARICATGSGVFLLAETGLLNDQPATTHWFYLDKLQREHPELMVKRHHLLTRSGNLYCAGSVNSIADLTIHLVEQLYDSAIAARIARQFSPEIRRRYSDQFYSLESSFPHQDETIVLAQQWLHEHYQDPVSMLTLAKKFSMSQRTLNRRFMNAIGLTPGQWLLRLRIEQARELLVSTNLDIGDIGLRCGFQDPGYFSRAFRKHMDTTPGHYRASVRNKLFSP